MSASTKLRHKTATYAEFTVVLDGLLVILLDIVGEVVNWDVVMLDVLHNLKKKNQTLKLKP